MPWEQLVLVGPEKPAAKASAGDASVAHHNLAEVVGQVAAHIRALAADAARRHRSTTAASSTASINQAPRKSRASSRIALLLEVALDDVPDLGCQAALVGLGALLQQGECSGFQPDADIL